MSTALSSAVLAAPCRPSRRIFQQAYEILAREVVLASAGFANFLIRSDESFFFFLPYSCAEGLSGLAPGRCGRAQLDRRC